MRRILAFLEDVVRLWREQGFRASFNLLRSRVFERTEVPLYELWTTGEEPRLPADWHVTVVRSAEDPVGMDLLRRTGEGLDLRPFRRKALVYVLSLGDEPAARSWYYPNSPLAKRFGPNAAYFGAMFVRPEFRGRGIQGLLITYMASFLPAGTRVLMEILSSNVASQKGAAKANATYAGRLRKTVILGQLVQARVEAAPSPEDSGTARGAPPGPGGGQGGP